MQRNILTTSKSYNVLVGAILVTIFFTGCSGTQKSPIATMTPSKTTTGTPPSLLPTVSVTPRPTKTITQPPSSSATPSAFPTEDSVAVTPDPGITLYTAQSGDTLAVVAQRFGVEPGEIISPIQITPENLIKSGQELFIPFVLSDNEFGPSEILLPDSEIIYSNSTVNFDVEDYIQSAGGHFSAYREYLKLSGWHTGAEIVTRVAYENGVSPRLLLALLEFQGKWITSTPANDEILDYPLRYNHPNEAGLYRQLTWASGQITHGYYGWRDGSLVEIISRDETSIRPAPTLNAGTAALQVLFTKLYTSEEWEFALSGEYGFITTYTYMFGDFIERDQIFGPIYSYQLTQPGFMLPFEPDVPWNFTSGPHPPWRLTGALAALDFAPAGTIDCEPNNEWVTAVASGLVIRSGNGVVALDLDKDGHQQTGWVVIYIHVASEDRVEVDMDVQAGSPIGHPSCEGGLSTGSHVHITRLYNGEWIPAGGPVPFEMGGWVAKIGEEPYHGYLVKDEQFITANRFGTHESLILWSSPKPAEPNEIDTVNP